MDEYGLRRACQWAGNSAATAMKNYGLVRHTDFDDVGQGDRQKGAAKYDAVLASTESHGLAKNPQKNGQCQIPLETLTVSMGDTGLEPVTSTL